MGNQLKSIYGGVHDGVDSMAQAHLAIEESLLQSGLLWGMDEDSLRNALIAWLTQYAEHHGWTKEDGSVNYTRLAHSFHVSRQVVSNWFLGVGFPSSNLIATKICPACKLTVSEFWGQLATINRQLHGLLPDTIAMADLDTEASVPRNAEELMQVLQGLSVVERKQFKALYLKSLVEQD